jgi:adenosine deaminase
MEGGTAGGMCAAGPAPRGTDRNSRDRVVAPSYTAGVPDVRVLPKAHLHVHLESAIRSGTLQELAEGLGVAVPVGPPEGFSGFEDFAVHNALVRDCLRRPEDFGRVAFEFCQDAAADGVRYAEVTFTAAAHGERLGRPEMPLEAVLDGLARGRSLFGIDCRLVLDHSRRRPVERAWQTLDLARRYAGDGVVAIGMAGDERYPLAPFAKVCAAARRTGVHLVHHAGECAGPASVREALALGGAERIGHGFRALEDPGLVTELAGRRIPIEVCPSSNVALGLVPHLAVHPLPKMISAGLVVTLSTDIPAVTGFSLSEEYRRVRDCFGYDDAELARLAGAAVDASFASLETKARLHAEIRSWARPPSDPPAVPSTCSHGDDQHGRAS